MASRFKVERFIDGDSVGLMEKEVKRKVKIFLGRGKTWGFAWGKCVKNF
jgi:hypothetical protein